MTMNHMLSKTNTRNIIDIPHRVSVQNYYPLLENTQTAENISCATNEHYRKINYNIWLKSQNFLPPLDKVLNIQN